MRRMDEKANKKTRKVFEGPKEHSKYVEDVLKSMKIGDCELFPANGGLQCARGLMVEYTALCVPGGWLYTIMKGGGSNVSGGVFVPR